MWIGKAAYPNSPSSPACCTIARMRGAFEPRLDEILAFCAEDPIERVFLEDIARRGLGRFSGLERDERLIALCHIGANVVPSGESCGSFADATARGQARMIIGEQRAVDELWAQVSRRMP